MKKIILALFLTCLMTGIGHAQLMLGESRVMLDVDPGQTILDTLSIHNTSEVSMAVKVYWQDFAYTPPYEGKKTFGAPGTLPYSMGGWVTFSPQEFTLPPRGKQEINYSLKVPSTAKGGYYGVLFFEQGEQAKPSGEKGVSVITRLGALFFIETKDKNISAKALELKADPPNRFTGVIENEGDVILIPKGVYYILDDGGLAVDRGETKKYYIPPGERGPFLIEFAKDLGIGKYTLVLTFDLGDGHSLVKEIDFSKSGGNSIDIIDVRD